MPKPKAKKAKPPPNARRRNPTQAEIRQMCKEIHAARTDENGVLCQQPHNEWPRVREGGILRITRPDRHRRGRLPDDRSWLDDLDDLDEDDAR